jgi:hypothetical protein
MYGAHLPILSCVAKSVLAQVVQHTRASPASVCTEPLTQVPAQVVCASAAERNWSVYGQIKSIKRSCMGHEVSDKLVYCHEALHLREKLQKANYKGKVEKWESDSDSDDAGSEDEADLAV